MKRTALVALALVLAIAGGVYGYRWYLIQQLRKPVLAQLNDPESAQFQGEVLFSGWTLESSAMCGEVNAKNRMGGYVGFRQFTVVADIVSINDEWMKDFKAKSGLPWCPYESAGAPWWHMRW